MNNQNLTITKQERAIIVKALRVANAELSKRYSQHRKDSAPVLAEQVMKEAEANTELLDRIVMEGLRAEQ
mgnify:CR=1 FL=1|jgi:TRAP-type mannitol/chloroaromatic compound transport system substrate-binding protein|tara:strand:- start:6164 stop:6373 length:210 start_codon:yes stop_codon:yes gene_type:complete